MKTKGIVKYSATNRLDTKFDPQWYVDIIIDKEEKKRLEEIGLKIKMEVDENENVIYRFKASRKEARKKGNQVVGTNPAPVVVDAALRPFDGIIGQGSEVYVVHRPYQWKNGKGWSSDLQKVQILELVPYAGGTNTDGYADSEEDELKIEGDPIKRTKAEVSQEVDDPSGHSVGDDVPF